MQGQTSPFARQRANAMFAPSGMPEIVPQEEPPQPTVLHQYAEHAVPAQPSQPQDSHYHEQSPAYAPAAEQSFHGSRPEQLQQIQVT